MYPELQILRDYIKTQNLKQTNQRETILKAFLGIDGHINVDELFEKSRKLDPSIGIATVYRTINIFKDCGLANEHSIPGGKKIIEKLYHRAHHDHLLCTHCGTLEEFEHPLIEKYQEEVAQQHGFKLQTHRMILYGICDNCAKK